MEDVADAASRETLKGEIFNLPVWEEAILFAVERMARGDGHQKAACGKAILAAFEVDPMLAAEMIHRATDEVWASTAATIQERLGRWHAPGKNDRALRFMMNTGRPEFIDRIWPFIANENDQVSLGALHNCRHFRPTLLGPDAAKRIRALPSQPRSVLLHEIALRGGIDSLDIATEVAKDDPEPGVQALVADALAFRRADRHIAELLKNARDEVFDLLLRNGPIEEVGDEGVMRGLAAARDRRAENDVTARDRLHAIIVASGDDDRSAEVMTIISEISVEKHDDPVMQLVYQARNRYPRAVAEGLLTRVRAGRSLFYGADDILASEGLSFEDEALLKVALAETLGLDDRAEAAASVLGPQATGRMIDALSEVGARLRNADGSFNKAETERYLSIRARIAHVPGASLVAAAQARSARSDNEQMARLAELLSRQPDVESDRSRPFDGEGLAAIGALVEDWGNRMLASAKAQRQQLATIATLACHVPHVSLLPVLKRLLDENLQRYRAFREEAAATGWQPGNVLDEARQPMTHEYYRAFLAIDAPETAALMHQYLADPQFGGLAAGVLPRNG